MLADSGCTTLHFRHLPAGPGGRSKYRFGCGSGAARCADLVVVDVVGVVPRVGASECRHRLPIFVAECSEGAADRARFDKKVRQTYK